MKSPPCSGNFCCKLHLPVSDPPRLRNVRLAHCVGSVVVAHRKVDETRRRRASQREAVHTPRSRRRRKTSGGSAKKWGSRAAIFYFCIAPRRESEKPECVRARVYTSPFILLCVIHPEIDGLTGRSAARAAALPPGGSAAFV